MATEKRLIDAKAGKKLFCAIAKPAEYNGVIHLVVPISEIDKLPTVDAVEVVHGQWKFLDIDGWWFNECSVCGDTTPNNDGSPPGWNYCPNCGAKMDGG